MSTAIGCHRDEPVEVDRIVVRSGSVERKRDAVLQEVDEQLAEAATQTAPEPVLQLPSPSGWVMSDPRPLPEEDHGFTVAYDYGSDLTVTFYQFTRGLNRIPSDLDSPLVRNELLAANNGIEQAVDFGMWDSASQIESSSVALGDSATEALYSRYQLVVEGRKLDSLTYVWPAGDAFCKLRCTLVSIDDDDLQAAFNELLTAFGEATTEVTH